jgi:hypothetical protein
MYSKEQCFKYSGDIKKLTKANSTIVGNRVIYIVKKDHEQKTSKLYIAYDYKTKIQLAYNSEKDKLIEYLNKRKEDLSVLDT